MTTFAEDLHALRQRAIAELFAQVSDDVEYIGVQVDGDHIEDAEFTDAEGKPLYLYPELDAYTSLNAAFGLRHDGLRALAVPYPEIPERVRSSLHAMSMYREGFTVVLRRPVCERKRPRPKLKPARENGDKSYTVFIEGVFKAQREVWAPDNAAARRKARAMLPKPVRITGVVRTPVDVEPRT